MVISYSLQNEISAVIVPLKNYYRCRATSANSCPHITLIGCGCLGQGFSVGCLPPYPVGVPPVAF